MKEKIVYVSEDGRLEDTNKDSVLAYEEKLAEQAERKKRGIEELKECTVDSFIIDDILIGGDVEYTVYKLPNISDETIAEFLANLRCKYKNYNLHSRFVNSFTHLIQDRCVKVGTDYFIVCKAIDSLDEREIIACDIKELFKDIVAERDRENIAINILEKYVGEEETKNV